MRKFVIFLMLIGLALLAFKVAVLLRQDSFVFFPDSSLKTTPRDVGLAYQDVSFASEDGTLLHGWFIPGPKGAPVVLRFHGNAGNIGTSLEFVKSMQPLGCSWFLVDYRQYGKSEGRISEEGMYKDARAAWEVCHQRFCPDSRRMVLWGFSIGTVAASHVASCRDAGALILEAPMVSAASMVSNKPFMELLYHFSSLSLDNAQFLRKCNIPKLFIHGDQDATVPFHNSKILFQAAPHGAEFYPVPGADHNNLFVVGGEEYRQKVRAFIQSHIPMPRPTDPVQEEGGR